MCGILGVYKIKGVEQQKFEIQLNRITHRGPDDFGSWFSNDNTLGLGSRRLAIQDLSPNGHMPMKSSDGRHVIVFNGEIYNHLDIRKDLIKKGQQFISHSDTETVLYAFKMWGRSCLDLLNGMFALAIYDIKEQKLFLARDRVGEKPLYYWHHQEGISFASELKQLLIDEDLPRVFSKHALKQYLEDGYLKGDQSFVEGVKKLMPAHWLEFDITRNDLSISKYWTVPQLNSEKQISKEELLAELDEKMGKAVKRQMIADVPLGVLLSGGVDSSLVTAYAAENTNKLKTFHISFEGFGKYNEADYARQVASHYGTEHIELSGNEMDFGMIDEALDFYDEPLADSSMLPTMLVSKLTRQHVTVALGGDGGDELFGGYSPYSLLQKQRSTIEKLPDFLRKGVAGAASLLPTGYRGRNFLKSLPGSTRQRFLHNRLFDKAGIKHILNAEVYEAINLFDSKPVLSETPDFVYDLTRYDFENYLPEDILVKVDRASMAASLEMRAPFLDKDVIEFAFEKVPGAYKATISELKILPKLLLKNKMPASFDVNRKQGFSIPLNDWIANKWFAHFVDEIECLPEVFSKKEALRMCYDVRKGYSNSARLFALIILSKWMRKYKISTL